MGDFKTMENISDASFWEFKGVVGEVDKWFLMGSPFPILLMLGSYLYFVLRCGPKFMKGRQPYNLRNILLVYNAVQVVYSIYLFQIGLLKMREFGIVENGCCVIENKELLSTLVSNHYLYFIAKITELLDTIFFVLRKKWNQITFLHVYHHSLMVFLAWVVLKYEPSYTFVFVGTINCFVHVIMYTYYGLAAFPELAKYLWWKKYITKLQLIQFMMAFIQITWNFFVTTCPTSYLVNTTAWSHLILFLYLFTDFYYKSYKQKKDDDSKRKVVLSKDGNSKISSLQSTIGNYKDIDKNQ